MTSKERPQGTMSSSSPESLSPPPPARLVPRGFHRFALGLACFTFLLVCAGGNVTSKGAGLSVPDWPLAYGEINPPGWFWIDNVRAEHGHRLIAATAGFLTLIFCWLSHLYSAYGPDPRSSLAFRIQVVLLASPIYLLEVLRWLVRWPIRLAFGWARPFPIWGNLISALSSPVAPRWLFPLSLLAVGAVIVQGLLGGITVLFHLPDAISISHALLGQTFFCITVGIALATAAHWRPAPASLEPDAGRSLVRLCFLLVGALYLQLFLGAAMRHTGSGLAIPDLRLLPPVGETALGELNRGHIMAGRDRYTAGQVHVHYAHRVWALGVIGFAIALIRRIVTRHADRSELVIPAFALGALVALQFMLGFLTILTGKQNHVATAHVGTGALVLAVSVILALESLRLSGRIFSKPAPAASDLEDADESRSSVSAGPTAAFPFQ